jgi:hypothetical protein
MKPDKIHDELATIKKQLTLQKLSQNNLPLFITSMVSLAGSVAFFGLCLLAGLKMSFGGLLNYLALAMIFGGVFIVTISLMMFGPKGIMPKQYSKQLERQNLEDLSEEELHTLIDFHRSQKNFDAADHASKYLMLKLDNNESDS